MNEMWKVLGRLSYLQIAGLTILHGLIGIFIIYLTGNYGPVPWLVLILSLVGIPLNYAISTFVNKDLAGDKKHPVVEWGLVKRLSFWAVGVAILAIFVGIFVQYVKGYFDPLSLLFPVFFLAFYLIPFCAFSYFRKKDLAGERPHFVVEWMTDENTSDEHKKILIRYHYNFALLLLSIMILFFGILLFIVLSYTIPV